MTTQQTPKQPKVAPKSLVITMSDGSTIELPFAAFKPSRAGGKLNANAITKAVVDGRMAQIGCNVTLLD